MGSACGKKKKKGEEGGPRHRLRRSGKGESYKTTRTEDGNVENEKLLTRAVQEEGKGKSQESWHEQRRGTRDPLKRDRAGVSLEKEKSIQNSNQ